MDRDAPHIDYIHMGPWPVYIGCTTDPDAWDRECKRLKLDGSYPFLGRETADATMHTIDGRGMVTYIITIRRKTRKRSTESYVAMIAHEALHIVQDMRDQLNNGKPFGDEAECYLLQYITQDCASIALNIGRSKSQVPV